MTIMEAWSLEPSTLDPGCGSNVACTMYNAGGSLMLMLKMLILLMLYRLLILPLFLMLPLSVVCLNGQSNLNCLFGNQILI